MYIAKSVRELIYIDCGVGGSQPVWESVLARELEERRFEGEEEGPNGE